MNMDHNTGRKDKATVLQVDMEQVMDKAATRIDMVREVNMVTADMAIASTIIMLEGRNTNADGGIKPAMKCLPGSVMTMLSAGVEWTG